MFLAFSDGREGRVFHLIKLSWELFYDLCGMLMFLRWLKIHTDYKTSKMTCRYLKQ